MKKQPLLSRVLAVLFVASGALSVALAHSEKALWIEMREGGRRTTTIAVTEGIAREFIDSKNLNVHFSHGEKRDLITREMLLAVLDGKEESVEAADPETGTTATVYLHDLKIPSKRDQRDRLVLETYKSGRKNFRIALPDLEIEDADNQSGSDELVKTSFGWKGFLPFLAKNGGAVYIDNVKDDTEVWIYVD